MLVKDQTSQTQNGIYDVTTIGDGSNPFVLTRSADFNQTAEVGAGSFTYVEAGTANQGKSFVQTERNPVLDTNNLVFTVFGETAIGTNSIANNKLNNKHRPQSKAVLLASVLEMSAIFLLISLSQ